jgi:hypothetical protein
MEHLRLLTNRNHKSLNSLFQQEHKRYETTN